MIALLGGCVVEKMDPTEPCKDVASAIASRSFACGADVKAANARAERFEKTYRCTLTAMSSRDGFIPEDLYHCPVSIQALSCADVTQYGDAFDRWLAVSPQCARMLTPGGS